MKTIPDFLLFVVIVTFVTVVNGLVYGWSKRWMVILIVAALIFAIIRSIMKC